MKTILLLVVLILSLKIVTAQNDLTKIQIDSITDSFRKRIRHAHIIKDFHDSVKAFFFIDKISNDFYRYDEWVNVRKLNYVYLFYEGSLIQVVIIYKHSFKNVSKFYFDHGKMIGTSNSGFSIPQTIDFYEKSKELYVRASLLSKSNYNQ